MPQTVNISTIIIIVTIARKLSSPLRSGTELWSLLLLTLWEVSGMKQSTEAEHLLLTLHSWDLYLRKTGQEKLLNAGGQRRLARKKKEERVNFLLN